jgi:hypothetical protein
MLLNFAILGGIMTSERSRGLRLTPKFGTPPCRPTGAHGLSSARADRVYLSSGRGKGTGGRAGAVAMAGWAPEAGPTAGTI